MLLSEFDYTLPKGLIAQHPVECRDSARLMVIDRGSGAIEHRSFRDIGEYLSAGDLLILNDTKVMPARLYGRRESGGKVEIFLLEKKEPVCEALVRPSARLKEGERIKVESGFEARILGRGKIGRFVSFDSPIDEILNECGHIPLPPYIKRSDGLSDRDSYQTVYCRNEGATASPTAGLHFTQGLLEKIERRGVRIAYVTLHTSYGTFAPVKSEDVEGHRMHEECFELPGETARLVNDTKTHGGRVYSVGTTSTRVLEHCAGSGEGFSGLRPMSGYTGLFIYPGYRFKVADALITNFHLPKSTLLLLVSAFAGRAFMLEAYNQAIEREYRFFSYGDAMLIL